MNDDEQVIRDLVETWLSASKEGDLETVLNLMDDEVIFLVAGKEPFGREAFAATSKQMKNVQMNATSEIKEIKVIGDWAWARTHLSVRVTPPDGSSAVRSGPTLTILRKGSGGKWVVFRDANLLTSETRS